MTDKDFNTGNDISSDIGSNTGGSPGADYGGDIASDDGVDLNDTSLVNRTHAEEFRGAIGSALYGGAEWSANNPVQAHTDARSHLAQMAISQRESLGHAAYHGSAAFMEAGINQHGKSPIQEHNNTLIDQAIEEGAASVERPEPIEPFADNQPIYDGETGIDLTDERLQGYGSIDEVPPEILNEIGSNETTENAEQPQEEIEQLETIEPPADIPSDNSSAGVDASDTNDTNETT